MRLTRTYNLVNEYYYLTLLEISAIGTTFRPRLCPEEVASSWQILFKIKVESA